MTKIGILVAGFVPIICIASGSDVTSNIRSIFSEFVSVTCHNADAATYELEIQTDNEILSALNHQQSEMRFYIDSGHNKLTPIRPLWCFEDNSDEDCFIQALCPINLIGNYPTLEQIIHINHIHRNFRITKDTIAVRIIQAARDHIANQTNKNYRKSLSLKASIPAEASEKSTWEDFKNFLDEQLSMLENEADLIDIDNSSADTSIHSRRRLMASEAKIKAAIQDVHFGGGVDSIKPSLQDVKNMVVRNEYLLEKLQKSKRPFLDSTSAKILATGLPLQYDPRYDDRIGMHSMKNCIKPEVILNQGLCGSCFAYAAATEMTYSVCAATGSFFKYRDVLHTLSPKYLFDCWVPWKKNEKPCDGGPLNILKENSPVYLFSDYRDSSRCGDRFMSRRDLSPSTVRKMCTSSSLNQVSNVPCSCEYPNAFESGSKTPVCQEKKLKKLEAGRALSLNEILFETHEDFFLMAKATIYSRGSFRTSIRAPSFFEDLYISDPYLSTGKVFSSRGVHDSRLKEGDHSLHAVVFIGWGYESDGKSSNEYFIIQNSWGLQFGDHGIFKVYAKDRLFTSILESKQIIVSNMDIAKHTQIIKNFIPPKIIRPVTELDIDTHDFYLINSPSAKGIVVGIKGDKVSSFTYDKSPGQNRNIWTTPRLNKFSSVFFNVDGPTQHPVNFIDIFEHLTRAFIHVPMLSLSDLTDLHKSLEKIYLQNKLYKLVSSSAVAFPRSLLCAPTSNLHTEMSTKTILLLRDVCKRLDVIDNLQSGNKHHFVDEVIEDDDKNDADSEGSDDDENELVVQESPFQSVRINPNAIAYISLNLDDTTSSGPDTVVVFTLECQRVSKTGEELPFKPCMVALPQKYATNELYEPLGDLELPGFKGFDKRSIITVRWNYLYFQTEPRSIINVRMVDAEIDDSNLNEADIWNIPVIIPSPRSFVQVRRSLEARVKNSVSVFGMGLLNKPFSLTSVCLTVTPSNPDPHILELCTAFELPTGKDATPIAPKDVSPSYLELSAYIFNLPSGLAFGFGCDAKCYIDPKIDSQFNDEFKRAPALEMPKGMELNGFIPRKSQRIVVEAIVSNYQNDKLKTFTFDFPGFDFSAYDKIKDDLKYSTFYSASLHDICYSKYKDARIFPDFTSVMKAQLTNSVRPICTFFRPSIMTVSPPKRPDTAIVPVRPKTVPTTLESILILNEKFRIDDKLSISPVVKVTRIGLKFTINCGIYATSCQIESCNYKNFNYNELSENFCVVDSKSINSRSFHIKRKALKPSASMPSVLVVRLKMVHPNYPNNVVLRDFRVVDSYGAFQHRNYETNAAIDSSIDMNTACNINIIHFPQPKIQFIFPHKSICQMFGWQSSVTELISLDDFSHLPTKTFPMDVRLSSKEITIIETRLTDGGNPIYLAVISLEVFSNKKLSYWSLLPNFTDYKVFYSVEEASKKFNVDSYFFFNHADNFGDLNQKLVINFSNIKGKPSKIASLPVMYSFNSIGSYEVTRASFELNLAPTTASADDVSKTLDRRRIKPKYKPTFFSNVKDIYRLNFDCNKYSAEAKILKTFCSIYS